MPRTLLCQLGVHTIILPEAFLLAPDEFTEVHAIGTDNTKSDYHLPFQFFARYPHVTFTLTILKEFEMVASAAEHEQYEEALWRWYVHHLPAEGLPTVCLSGGMKSMVASLQKAAHLFGAEEVFHVLVNRPEPTTLEELAQNTHRIDFVKMGRDDGWAMLRHLCRADTLPIETELRPEGGSWLKMPTDFRLRQTVQQLLDATRLRTHPQVGELPFNSLALLTAEQQGWLQQPLQWDDLDWLQQLPKTELHCHLGGFAAFGEALEAVRQADNDGTVFPNTLVPPADWPLPPQPIKLDDYMRLGDNTGTQLFKNPKRLQKQIELLYRHLEAENVHYAEIRCSPDNYKTNTRSAWEVLEHIRQCFQGLMEDGGRCHVNLIVIATRKQEGDLSPISRHLALAVTASQHISTDHQCRVVGVDLAGFENPSTRAAYFAQDFVGVHRCGLAVTAHAGENDDAEGIWQAVHALHARRVGHALHLWQAPDLMRTMADRKIAVEMCPYANYQIKGFAPMSEADGKTYPSYPLLDYLRKGVLVTVNTDNIGISVASLSQNFQLLSLLCPNITRLQVLQLIRNGLEAAFISPNLRQQLLQQFDQTVFQACKKQIEV